MDRYIVIENYCYRIDSDYDRTAAMDALAETESNTAPIFEVTSLEDSRTSRSILFVGGVNTEDAVDTGEVLTARQYFVIPFTRTDSDDYGHSCTVLVAARDAEHAKQLCRDAVDEDAFWSEEANISGDTCESSGDDSYYKLWFCDCGEQGCESETNPHDSLSEMVSFHFAEAKVLASLDDAPDCDVEVGL